MSNDARYVGDQTLQVTYMLQDYLEGWSFQTSLNVTIHPQPLVFTEAAKPFFELSEGTDLQYKLETGEPWEWYLPKMRHPLGDEVEMKLSIDYGQLDEFVIFDDKIASQQHFDIPANKTTSSDIGNFSIGLTIEDAGGIKSDILVILMEIYDPEKQDTTNSTDDSEDADTKETNTLT